MARTQNDGMSDIERRSDDCDPFCGRDPSHDGPCAQVEPESWETLATRLQAEKIALHDELRGAVEALHEALDAARTFNRGGMTWQEYDALLVRLASQHPRGQ